MFWTFLLAIFFIFSPSVRADTPTLTPTPTSTVAITWGSGDNNVRQNDQFSVNVNLSNLSVGTTYYVGAKGGPNSGDCYIIFNNGYNGCNGFNSGNLFPINWSGNGLETLYLKALGASGSYQIYAYIYDSSGNLLKTTSSAYSITINDQVPTSTPTLTPTITPTPTITIKPTFTPTLTPTDTPLPVLTPILEATPTDVSLVVADVSIAPTPTSIIVNTDNSSSSSTNYLPFIFIGFGGLLLILTLVIPKIMAKIKSKKNPPAGESPMIVPTPVILPPTVASSIPIPSPDTSSTLSVPPTDSEISSPITPRQ